jgi:hypothetical protein
MKGQRIEVTHGDAAQKVAAATVGGYAAFVGFFVGQFLCEFLGNGG